MIGRHTIRFSLLALLSISLAISGPSFGCDCGNPGPACNYVGAAAAVFVGRVIFNDDDGISGTMQRTLVRFQVEESFKGLPPNAKDVWVDPGSFTSCYANYHVGERLLVFGYRDRGMPSDATTMSVDPKRAVKNKPWPPGIDPKDLPTIYWAPECSGTRLITPETEGLIAPEIEYLRRFKAGTARSLVTGRVFQDERFGIFDAPGIPGVDVSIEGNNLRKNSQTDANGRYLFNDIPPGHYVLKSRLTAYESTQDALEVDVPSSGCGWADFDMIGSGVITGQLLDHDGRPVRDVKITVLRLGADGKPVYYGFKETLPDSQGRFEFENLPEGDFQIGVNVFYAPDADSPYPPTTWSEGGRSTIHLDAGEHRQIAPFNLPVAAIVRQVPVRVFWPDGRPAKDVDVWAYVGGEPGAHASTDSDGGAQLDLLEGLDYAVEAKIWVEPSEKREVARSGVTRVTPGSEPIHLDLCLCEQTPNYR
jgi:hypothetical protein